jgi:hypothetical protein
MWLLHSFNISNFGSLYVYILEIKPSFSGMLHSIGWYLVTDVSGQPTGPVFKGYYYLILECGTNRQSLNVGYQVPTYAAKHLHAGVSISL